MYTKAQCDLIWSRFATIVAQQAEIASMQSKWDEMAKKSALKDKIIAKLKAERRRLDNGVYVAQVNRELFDK